MITIVADFSVKPECAEKFIELAAECTAATRREPGNCSYKVFRSRTDESKFTFIEEWMTDNAIKNHGKSMHFTRFIDMIKPLIECEPIIRQLEKVAEIR